MKYINLKSYLLLFNFLHCIAIISTGIKNDGEGISDKLKSLFVDSMKVLTSKLRSLILIGRLLERLPLVAIRSAVILYLYSHKRKFLFSNQNHGLF